MVTSVVTHASLWRASPSPGFRGLFPTWAGHVCQLLRRVDGYAFSTDLSGAGCPPLPLPASR